MKIKERKGELKGLEKGCIIPLVRNFIFIQSFYYHDGVKRLEYFISDYFDLEYEKVKGNIILLPRDEELESKYSAETQVDILLHYENKTINIELNNKEYRGIKNRNMIFIHKVAGAKYKKGKYDYGNIGDTIQINLNNYKCNEEKLVNRYRLYEEDSKKIFSENFLIDEVDMTKVDNYKSKNKWEEKIINWCILFTTNKLDIFKETCDKIMSKEESGRFVKLMEQFSSDDEIIRLENDAELLRKAVIEEERAEARKLGLEEGHKEGHKLGLEEGMKEGMKEGIKEGIIETAKNMLSDDVDIDIISKYTGLSKEEIEKLK